MFELEYGHSCMCVCVTESMWSWNRVCCRTIRPADPVTSRSLWRGHLRLHLAKCSLSASIKTGRSNLWKRNLSKWWMVVLCPTLCPTNTDKWTNTLSWAGKKRLTRDITLSQYKKMSEIDNIMENVQNHILGYDCCRFRILTFKVSI